MPIMKYIDTEDNCWAVLIPYGVLDYSTGAFLGPPELKINLLPDEIKKLRCALVEHQLYNAEQLNGKRSVLVQIVKELRLNPAVVREITAIYQGEMDHE